MNTDQAFELLKNAGVAEDIIIKTVRRWLRERKIKYDGLRDRRTQYILDDIDEAFNLLIDAGVARDTGIQIVKRWMREGKIKNVGKGKHVTEYISIKNNSNQFLNHSSDQDKLIRQLKATIKAQDEHIQGIEELYKTSLNTLIQERDKLNKEIFMLENELRELQRETGRLLKDNSDLREELAKLREKLSKGNKSDVDKTQAIPPKTVDLRQKLGLSKTASFKEIMAGYKKLLKITHPDHGGNATAFHYIKTDYDHFRKSMK